MCACVCARAPCQFFFMSMNTSTKKQPNKEQTSACKNNKMRVVCAYVAVLHEFQVGLEEAADEEGEVDHELGGGGVPLCVNLGDI